MCINGFDGYLEPFFVATIRFRCQFNNGVKRNLDVWKVLLREVVEVCIETSKDGLNGRLSE